MTITASSISETHALAAALAKTCCEGDCILLQGDLGSGKTEFARGFIRALQGDKEEVVSPTFTLAQSYAANGKTVWHFDLYRLESARDVRELGMEEAIHSAITLIEWPELAKDFIPAEALSVHIHCNADQQRRFTFSGVAGAWEQRLQAVGKNLS